MALSLVAKCARDMPCYLRLSTLTLCHAPRRALVPTQNGCTALHLAATEGHSRLVARLLAEGAAVDAKDRVRGGRNMCFR